MFAVIRKSYLYLESYQNAPFDHEERSFDSACSGKIRLILRTVIRDVGLPG